MDPASTAAAKPKPFAEARLYNSLTSTARAAGIFVPVRVAEAELQKVSMQRLFLLSSSSQGSDFHSGCVLLGSDR